MATSEQLEREAERTRHQIADTIDELRDRLTPGRMMDEALHYVRRGGGRQFVQNLGRQVGRNPIPSALASIGVAWLMLATTRSDSRAFSGSHEDFGMPDTSAAADRVIETGEKLQRGTASMASNIGQRTNAVTGRTKQFMRDVRQAAGGGVEKLAQRAQSGATQVTEKAGAAGSRLQAAADVAGETAADAFSQTQSAYGNVVSGARRTATTIGQSASALAGDVSKRGRMLVANIGNEPLVLAGLGLALGALIGATLPRTKVEDEFMGESSEAVKESAQEQWEKGKEMVERTLETAKEETTEMVQKAAEQLHEVPLVPAGSEDQTKGG